MIEEIDPQTGEIISITLDGPEVVDGEATEIHGPDFPPNVTPQSTEIEVRPQAGAVTLFGTDNPAEVLQRASDLARPLANLIERQGLFTMIGGKKHVEVEGWTTLGSMLGVFPVLESCEPVELNGIKGFVAIVEARTRDGAVVGRAQSYCMRNETKWGSAKDYAVASMAQTRATSKALRMPLGFIMSIAGYSTTPASEREVDQVQAGGGGAGNAAGSGEGSPGAPRPGTIAAALERIRKGLELLKDQPEWTEDSVLKQCSVIYQKPVSTWADLSLKELNEIIAGMIEHGKVAI